MKKVLITGSQGFVGRHLWHELLENGYDVYGADLGNAEGNDKVFVCDITKAETIKKILESVRPDAIVHLAGQPKPGLSFKEPQATIEINTIGFVNLLESIRGIADYSPRLVVAGTSEEHGVVSPKDLPITEKTPLNPINPYAISKVANWYLSQQYTKAFGFDIVYVTPFTHTGPGQRQGFLAPDVASQIAKIEKGSLPPVVLTGDLSARRDYLDVRDVVRAYRLLLEKGVAGERYIVSSGKSIPVQNIVDTLLSLSEVKILSKIDPSRSRPSDILDLYGDYSKIKISTGWEPQIPLEKTLTDLLDWHRSQD